ncbi:hypothetical protein CpphoP_1010 [Corynebacterium pseudotuberculosis]|nr:Hypothetical protein Cp226_1702 [Corynebacterium pseudotuberculosis]AQU90568.1 hypothetical protein CpphoP_1010 [Corynebacterium pseudotuberculosis]
MDTLLATIFLLLLQPQRAPQALSQRPAATTPNTHGNAFSYGTRPQSTHICHIVI